MNREQATKIVLALYDDDAWLCSIPHGQYESYSAYTQEQAIQKIMNLEVGK